MATQAMNPDPIAAMQKMLDVSVAEQTAALRVHVSAVAAARAPAAAASAAQVSEIPAKVFESHIQGMQQHYASTVIPHVLYQLPAKLFPATPSATQPHTFILAHPVVVTAGAKAVDAALERIHAEALAAVKNHANALVAAAVQAEKHKLSTAQFAAQMNALRARDKQNARIQIDRVYAALGDLGKQHPDQRARILQTANHSGSFFSALGAEMEKISHAVEAKAAVALHALTSPVQSAVETAGHWAAGAVKSVGNFFKHLF